jgi:hypothetical protein
LFRVTDLISFFLSLGAQLLLLFPSSDQRGFVMQYEKENNMKKMRLKEEGKKIPCVALERSLDCRKSTLKALASGKYKVFCVYFRDQSL